jgi:hypothetical protein
MKDPPAEASISPSNGVASFPAWLHSMRPNLSRAKGTAPQALFQMNSPHARRWAQSLATHVEKSLGPAASAAELVKAAYQETLTRNPSPAELEIANTFLKESADAHASLVDLCQNLLALNEFVYIP